MKPVSYASVALVQNLYQLAVCVCDYLCVSLARCVCVISSD